MLFFVFFACLNKDVSYLKNDPSERISAKQWFKKNGGKYKDGAMLIQGAQRSFYG